MLGGMLSFMGKKVGGRVDTLKNPKTLRNFILNFVRVFSVVLIALAVKLRGEIRRDSQDELKKLEEELQQIKKDNIDLVEVDEEGEMIREGDEPDVLQ